MKKYWLTLFPETFLWLKNGNTLLYNTDNQKSFVLNCSPEIEDICKEFLQLENLYTIELDENQLLKSDVYVLVEKIEQTESGALVERNGINPRPVSYFPYFKLQKNIEHLKLEHDRGIGGAVINNLHEVTLYLNGSKNGNNSFYKQIPYPVDLDESLDINSVISFISKFKGGNLHKINIVGDIHNYHRFEFLLDWLLMQKFNIHLFLLLEDFDACDHSLEKCFANGVNINLIIDGIFLFPILADIKKDVLFKVKPVFVVHSEEDFEKYSEIMLKYEIEKYDMFPLFSGTNIDFFEQFVFMANDDIENIKLSKREIFANMAMNIHFYGKLTVMPDRKVYANVNNAPLGYVDYPIYDMIYNEMTEGQSWLNIRNMKPCCDCIYQWLCPSLSNYELAIGKPNLCQVKS